MVVGRSYPSTPPSPHYHQQLPPLPASPAQPRFNGINLTMNIFRFTDSPEPGSKGRAKRNRTSLTPSELEPRKNLRSSKAKGKGKSGKGDEFNFPAPSSPAKDSGKRKGRPDDIEDAKKRKRTGSESEGDGSGEADSEEQGDDSLVSAPEMRRPNV